MKATMTAYPSSGSAGVAVQPLISALRPGGRLLLVAAIGLFLTGCLSKPALVTQSFVLQTPAITGSTPNAHGPVLALRPVQVSPLFAGQPLVYRIGPNEYETDPYAGFLVPPAQSLGISLRGYLAKSGIFANVIGSDSPLKADEVLQAHVTELYGDFRQPGHPAAVLSMRLVLTNAKGVVLLLKDYSHSVPLKQNTAAEVVAGYDQALAKIMAEAAGDLVRKKQ